MDRQELIQTLIPGLAKNTGSAEKEVRQVLETYNQTGLEKEFQRQRKLGYLHTPNNTSTNDQELLRQIEQIRADVRREFENNPGRIRERQQQAAEDAELYRDYALTQLFKAWVPGHGWAKRNKASEVLIISWLNFDETLTVDWFIRVLAENPELASGLQWSTKDKAQSLADDQETFKHAASSLRSFGLTEANFNLTRSILGPNFTYTELQDRIADGGLQLSSPSQAEREEWAASDIESHNARLLQASTTELRTIARNESEQKRTQHQIDTANESFEATKRRDEAIGGYPVLPPELTKQEIRNAPTERIKYWLKRFGQSQIDARLQGRS